MLIVTVVVGLLQKEWFSWGESPQHAFDTLKSALSQTPVLATPKFSNAFTLDTDASGFGIRAVLSQLGHPIVHYSKKLSPRMQQALAYHPKMYAIAQAVGKRQYLLHRKFIILTDKKNH